MNNKVISFIKNFSYSLMSNLVSMIISTLVILVVPKLIGVEDYGYWQLYLFYSSYVGFLHFGWNDGIYLRYGGKHYNGLDKNLFFSQFYMLILLQFTFLVFIMGGSDFFVIDNSKSYILKMTAICMIIMNVRYMLLFILQGTNRIKEYAQITMMDKFLYSFLIIAFLIFGINDFKILIVADLIGKLLSLVYAMYCCKDIVFRKLSSFYFSYKETKENISVGIKLMFANIASRLIIGVVRFGIERSWSVVVFGQISLTLSISNFLLTFINAIGLVMFPILRRTDEKKLPIIYNSMRDFLMIILLGILIFYYPLKVILGTWLPAYEDSLKYMALLFPMLVFEGKMALLINTYLKTIRKEKLMLKINIISLSISVLFTIITTTVLKDLNLTVLSIILVLVIRSIIGEIYLSKILDISTSKDITLEVIITFIFILSGWYIHSWMSLLMYTIAYIIYLLIKKKDIINTFQAIKEMVKS